MPASLRLKTPAVIALAAVLAPLAARGENALPPRSPFESPAGSAPAAAAAETIEFAGVTTVGKKTSVNLFDKQAKKSRWVELGETRDGVTVLNYDDVREQIVVRINGAEKVLSLRKAAAAAGNGMAAAMPLPAPADWNTPPPAVAQPAATPVALAPAAVPSAAPAAPAAPPTPELQARQEQEARMLVSDLLEIGMAQRKAYEEAQRKAAESPGQPTSSPAQPITSIPANPPAPVK